MRYWAVLILSILFEVGGTTSMKLSNGFAKLTPSVLVFVLYAAAFSGMIIALKGIDLGVAYAVWAGLGTALTAGVGFLWFHETVTASKLVCISLIIMGSIGLKLTDSDETTAEATSNESAP